MNCLKSRPPQNVESTSSTSSPSWISEFCVFVLRLLPFTSDICSPKFRTARTWTSWGALIGNLWKKSTIDIYNSSSDFQRCYSICHFTQISKAEAGFFDCWLMTANWDWVFELFNGNLFERSYIVSLLLDSFLFCRSFILFITGIICETKSIDSILTSQGFFSWFEIFNGSHENPISVMALLTKLFPNANQEHLISCQFPFY